MSQNGNAGSSQAPSKQVAAALGRVHEASARAGTRIDTGTGLVQDANGTTIPVATSLVTQMGGPSIRVLIARTFVIDAVVIVGSNPIAFVAAEEILVTGTISVAAVGITAGPGAVEAGTCVAQSGYQYSAGACGLGMVGLGGGGNATVGGQGGASSFAVGEVVTGNGPLKGGCRGGSNLDPTQTSVAKKGGGGGGALQLVAARSITLRAGAVINAAGGGGEHTAGGGSGGLVILESPLVTTETASGIAANGGSGGGCSISGSDGPPTTSSAVAPNCQYFFAGRGGTALMLPGSGCEISTTCGMNHCPPQYGGGGGAVGRLRVATNSGGFANSGFVSAALETAILTIN